MKILTIDLEEWFHLLDINSIKTANEWNKYEVRIHKNVERILSILDKTQTRATVFCLGWIAEKYPEIILNISKEGHEIGSHTQMHQLVYEQSPLEFKQEIESSVKLIEDLTGKKVKCFRAPGFSIREDTPWAFEIIASMGIEYDSSIFPANRAHGGYPSYHISGPSIIKHKGITLKEFPINYMRTLFNLSIIFSGGGYFRLFPYPFIKNWTLQSDYILSYIHPRDLDPDQPMLKDLPLARKFKSYVGIRTAEHKFEKWLRDFRFIDIQTASGTIDWTTVPVVEI